VIHPTAIIDPTAKIAADVSIGPWTVIGADVEIGAGCKISSHVVINGPTIMGKNNHVFQFSSIGELPQDLKFKGESTRLEIGDGNIFRESVTVNRGTGVGGGLTRIGNHNLFMAYVHIAHDCIVGNHNIFANNASLSGHVTIADHVTMAGFTAVHQFVKLGSHSFLSGGCMVGKDVLPFLLVSGNPGEPYGLNVVGLQRRGFSSATLTALRRAYRSIFRKGLKTEDAIAELQTMVAEHAEVQMLIDALQSSERGIAREMRREATTEEAD
jgi:UDP-N-acetylglucosamine acyltransferase